MSSANIGATHDIPKGIQNDGTKLVRRRRHALAPHRGPGPWNPEDARRAARVRGNADADDGDPQRPRPGGRAPDGVSPRTLPAGGHQLRRGTDAEPTAGAVAVDALRPTGTGHGDPIRESAAGIAVGSPSALDVRRYRVLNCDARR